jgi:L-ascorbate metabolism protein UlaG (beta-lactamase superfamily)
MDALVKWLGHASFEIKAGDKTIYIDPYEGEYPDKADLILMTHSHPDHCDAGKLRKILRKDTVIIAPQDCSPKAGVNVKSLRSGEEFGFGPISIRAVHAYNVRRFRSPGVPFHPKGFGVGYLITIKGKTIYHAGDTDFIPEMKNLGNVTLALLPCGGYYTMDVKEALEATMVIKPEIVMPMHRRDAEVDRFKEEVENGSTTKVLMLEPGEEFRI